MARSIWSGTIEFGLVSIPISLSAATESKSISFHQLHKKCGTQIREQRYCPHCEEVVDYEDLEKGFEYQKNQFVIVTKAELENLPLPSKKIIVLSSFVEQSQIDPIYFDGSYYAEPNKLAERPFSLLMTALKKNKLVAIGTLSLRNKERLCCIRTMGEALVVELLLYPDEIREAPSIKAAKEVSEKELAVANHLIKIMSGDFEPQAYEDHYREALKNIIDEKLEGKDPATIEAPKRTGRVIDLMDALQASIESAKKRSQSRNTTAKQKTSLNQTVSRQKKKVSAASAKAGTVGGATTSGRASKKGSSPAVRKPRKAKRGAA